MAAPLFGCILALASHASAIDEAHAAKARAMSAKAISYLKTQQDKDSGGWSVPGKDTKEAAAAGAGRPHMPAITGLALTALLANPDTKQNDPAVTRAVTYLLSFQQPDGGIYDRILPSYNTSICVSALSKIDSPKAKAAIPPAQKFLRGLQWSENAVITTGGTGPTGDAPKQVTPDNQFYGGVGYGKHGRPDLSNLGMMLQAMHDSGVSPEDESFKRAVAFLQRTQMLGSVNDMEFAKGSKQGGFVYATVPNAESVEGPAGESMATDKVEETLDDGTKVSRLRAYGSMTYTGFKSYLYADLPKDDIRVRAAYDWIRRNYNIKENPGVGNNGLYYYYVTMSRALAAWGEPTIKTLPSPGAHEDSGTHDWANDLIDHLATLQNEDGSFKSVDERWMENNPVLITAYAGITLGEAMRSATKTK
jgi:squalene-hopene/tetraprenyl-beta-curcumene cyclase